MTVKNSCSHGDYYVKVHASTGAALTRGRRAEKNKTYTHGHAIDIRASFARLRCDSCVGRVAIMHGVCR